MKKFIFVSLIVSMLMLSVILMACARPLAGETVNIGRKQQPLPAFACKDTDYEILVANKNPYTLDFLTKGKVFSDQYPNGKEDYCQDSKNLMEGRCSNNKYIPYQMDCTKLGSYECKDGACISSYQCIDSDNQNIMSKGTTTITNTNGQIISIVNDSCIDLQTLSEGICIDVINEASQIKFICPIGTACTDGACFPTSCSDSDNGKNFKLKGTTQLIQNGAIIDEKTDKCVSQGKSVREYYCLNNSLDTIKYNCGLNNLCVDGACVPEYHCIDSEDGINISLKGTITLTYSITNELLGKFDDHCLDAQTLVEGYCSDATDTISKINISCPNETKCFEGACIPELHCEDSDKGINFFVKGTVVSTEIPNGQEDYCYTSTDGKIYLIEGLCKDDKYIYLQKLCEEGGPTFNPNYNWKCKDGACVKS